METKEKSIYDLKLHETCSITATSVDGVATNYYSVIRVASGWIYHIWDSKSQDYIRDIFVPFDNEFQK